MAQGPVLTTGDLALAADMARRWPAAPPRVQATLWWYSSSWNVVDGLVRPWLRDGVTVDLSGARPMVGADGVILGVEGRRTVRTIDDAADGLAEFCAKTIADVCTVARVGRPSLWAIASDSVANCVLAELAVPGGTLDASGIDLARRLAAGRRSEMPVPRFVEVAATSNPSHIRTFVRRSSCCLILDVGSGMCSSCPRRTPAERAARLAALVR